jgi:dienelactone hydrolase
MWSEHWRRRALKALAVGIIPWALLVASQGLALAQATPIAPALVGAPPGAEALGAQWISAPVLGGGAVLAAVIRPAGEGPFPTLILFHGTHGFGHEYVRLAQDIARGGVLTLAACWFRGARGSGTRFITPIPCPDAPAMSPPSSPESMRTVEALVRAAQTLPGVRADRLALFGHSRGGGAALNYVLRGGRVQATVLNSTGYPADLTSRAADITAPVLILHGTADSPEDGGVAVTTVERARDFHAALRSAAKTVEAVYYEGGRHNDIFGKPSQREDQVKRIVAFLLRHLRE